MSEAGDYWILQNCYEQKNKMLEMWVSDPANIVCLGVRNNRCRNCVNSSLNGMTSVPSKWFSVLTVKSYITVQYIIDVIMNVHKWQNVQK